MNDLIKHTSAEDVDELAGWLPNVHRTLHLIPSTTETIVHTFNPTNSEGRERSSKASLSHELYSNSEASLGYIRTYLKIKCLAGCLTSCAMQVGMLLHPTFIPHNGLEDEEGNEQHQNVLGI